MYRAVPPFFVSRLSILAASRPRSMRSMLRPVQARKQVSDVSIPAPKLPLQPAVEIEPQRPGSRFARWVRRGGDLRYAHNLERDRRGHGRGHAEAEQAGPLQERSKVKMSWGDPFRNRPG